MPTNGKSWFVWSVLGKILRGFAGMRKAGRRVEEEYRNSHEMRVRRSQFKSKIEKWNRDNQDRGSRDDE